MGILNVTPDSFSGGLEDLGNVQEQLQTVKDMVHDGADIIDIGGQSTRPGACLLSAKEELQRVLPIIRYPTDPKPQTIQSDLTQDNHAIANSQICLDMWSCNWQLQSMILSLLSPFFGRAVRSDRTTSDVVLSIDTFHSKVAVAAVEAGADIINDVSAGRFDSNMYMEVGFRLDCLIVRVA